MLKTFVFPIKTKGLNLIMRFFEMCLFHLGHTANPVHFVTVLLCSFELDRFNAMVRPWAQLGVHRPIRFNRVILATVLGLWTQTPPL